MSKTRCRYQNQLLEAWRTFPQLYPHHPASPHASSCPLRSSFHRPSRDRAASAPSPSSRGPGRGRPARPGRPVAARHHARALAPCPSRSDAIDASGATRVSPSGQAPSGDGGNCAPSRAPSPSPLARRPPAPCPFPPHAPCACDAAPRAPRPSRRRGAASRARAGAPARARIRGRRAPARAGTSAGRRPFSRRACRRPRWWAASSGLRGVAWERRRLEGGEKGGVSTDASSPPPSSLVTHGTSGVFSLPRDPFTRSGEGVRAAAMVRAESSV